MDRYYCSFEVRWSDLDANRHLANASYMNYGSHTRIKFLSEHGFPQVKFQEHQIGPVVFSEGFHFFKEMMPNEQVYITLELQGASENYMFFQFHHNFYKQDGSHAAFAELYGGWMSLARRRLTLPPKELVQTLDKMPRTSDFKTLSKEDLKRVRMQPQTELFVP
ncbi:MAG TPA: thioesterase [Microscillaceae bacterium]|nr:thioesterase [Microscillaceae bacterium]